MTDMPAGWVRATVDDTGQYINGMAFKPSDWVDEGLPIIRIQNLTDREKKLNRTRRRVEDRYLVENGDILVSWSATLDAFIWDRGRAVLNQHIFKVVPETRLIDKDFLYHGLRTKIREMIESEHLHGSTMRHINRGPFLAHSFTIPPLREQRRIVTKIDGLCTKSKRSRDHLDHIPRLVEKYKQAVLATAFCGDLTREWRESHRPQAVVYDGRNIAQRAGELGELPATWCWTAVQDVASITGGLTKNAKRAALPRQVPYVRVANVYADELRLDDIAQIGCTDQELAKTRLRKGDLLIVEGNGSIDQIGRVALWNDEISGCSHQNHIIRGRPGSALLPEYALNWLLSPEGRRAIEAVASSSSGLHTLSISKVEGLPIPICSLDEQREIVRKIKAAMSWIRRLASETTNARKLIDHLDQAILARAFRGELVPQDSNDEPASVLLERIKADRAAGTNVRKRRGRRSAAN